MVRREKKKQAYGAWFSVQRSLYSNALLLDMCPGTRSRSTHPTVLNRPPDRWACSRVGDSPGTQGRKCADLTVISVAKEKSATRVNERAVDLSAEPPLGRVEKRHDARRQPIQLKSEVLRVF